MNIADKPIYPIFNKTLGQTNPNGAVTIIGGTGMTLLEHYAGLAMQAFCVEGNQAFSDAPTAAAKLLAQASIYTAKALIAELEKEQNNENKS